MTYPGYMALANDDGETIELVNAARVKAYTDNLAPTMGLRGCEDCDGLEAAVGDPDGYTTPEGDNAPWYDPTDPATADFYGVYPLGFAGIDDSTRSIESAELAGDGSVVVGSRFTGKDIRVNGVAFAKDEAALSAGISWLDNALNGTEEGRCFGDRLNVFSSCPPVQVLPPGFAEPWVLETPVPQSEIDAWTTTSGTITDGPLGLTFDWEQGDPQKIACREITGLIPNEQYQLRMRIRNFGDYFVRISDSCSSPRTNLAPNPRLQGWVWQGGGVADVEADVTMGGPLGLGYRQSITTSANASSPYNLVMPTDEYIPVTPGVLYQASMYAKAPVGTLRLAATFRDSGGSVITSDVRFEQGVIMDDTWQRLSGVLLAPENAATMEIFLAFTVGVGDIQPNMEFGAANLLVEIAPYDVLRFSLATDPRAEFSFGWGFNTGTGGAVTGSSVTGAVDGPVLYGSVQSDTYRRHEVTTEPTGGSAGPIVTQDNNLLADTITAGTPWVTGAFFRSNREVSGTAYHRIIGAGSVVLEEFTQPFTLLANTWTYIAGGGNVTSDLSTGNVDEFYVWPVIGGVGGGADLDVGDIYDSTGLLVQVGSANTGYYDDQRPAEGGLAYVPYQVLGGDGSAEVDPDDAGTYFDGYTDGFRWDGPPDDSQSTTDLGIDYETTSGWSQFPPTEPDVLDFVPRTDSVFLSITPTQSIASFDTLELVIDSALVRRVPRPGVLAYGSGHNVVPPSDGWTHSAPATMSVQWIFGEDVEFTSVWTIGTAPFGSALDYTPQHGIERTVFGMIPGNRYRLMIDFESVWFETDGAPGQDIDPFVSVGTGTGAVATYTVDNDSSHFWVIEFTATETSTVIGLHPNADLNLGSFGAVWWIIDQYMVEEILETDGTEPDPGRIQARTMYEVKASQGPLISNLRRASCGVMAEVTYSLRAGNPFKYRDPIFAGGLPAGTSVVVPDTPCSDDGLPQVINYMYNPSVEFDTTDWASAGAGVVETQHASVSAIVGEYVFRAQAPDSPGNRLDSIGIFYRDTSVADGPTPASGSTLTVSVYFRTTRDQALGTYDWNINVYMVGFDPILFSGSEELTETGVWQRIESTFTIPSNVALDDIEMFITSPASMTQGGLIDADGMMLQTGTEATAPFDETFPNVEWSGTPNASALILTPVAEDISDDPDCPAPPAPPAPPQVDNSCVAQPAAYNRTVVNVSADAVPRNLTAYPIITLIAGAAAVRQARIRFWENPDSLTIDELGPCDYDGEIIVSFLAAEATMVINGVLQEATVSKPGFEDANANHVLYGPDGGPVDWPELTGGIPYLVTLELDSGEPYADTLMSIELVVRD